MSGEKQRGKPGLNVLAQGCRAFAAQPGTETGCHSLPDRNPAVMPSEFSHTRQVEFHETDMAGIVHFANFFRWMESCETAFYRSLGVPLLSFVPGQVVGWPRVNVSCAYRVPLRFNDTFVVHLFVKKLTTRSVTYVFQFRKDGTLCATGEVTAVCVTADAQGTMVARPIPADIRAHLQEAPESAYL
jgi:acyl-CoA thioester hydrolase